MMVNSSGVSYFTFTAYSDTGKFRYFWFVFLMYLYVVIVGVNLLLIVVICANKDLHKPMYMFLCSLFVNELYGSSWIFPFLLLQILSDVHTVPASLCFLQIFGIYTYGNVEFLNLAVMSYDRYLAICCPLQYNARMTTRKVAVLTFLTWLFPAVEVATMLYLSLTLKLCGNVIDKVYCDNYYIVKLACSDTTVNNVYGLSYTILIIVTVVVLILYSYIRILKVCFSGSKQAEKRQRAIRTCAPHIASMLNFSFGTFFEIMQSRFNMKYLPNMLRVFLSLYFLTCQPLFSTVIYGLLMSKIRDICRRLVCGKTI